MTETKSTRNTKRNLLTAKKVETAKPTDKDVILNDGAGLSLRITPSGTRTWRYRYKFDNKSFTRTLGDIGLADARAKADDLRKLIAQGFEPNAYEQSLRIEREQAEQAKIAAIEAERAERESRRLFKPTVERWLELEISQRKGGSGEMLRSFTKDVFPTLAERELGSVKRGDLLDVLDSIKARGSNVQANRTLTALKQFFNWCLLREWVESNPLALVKKAKIGGTEKERERTLSESELVELRGKIPDAGLSRETELALWILLTTTTRVGELIQARWEHIDLDAGIWTIPASNAKNAKLHTVYLSDFAKRYFEDLRNVHHWSEWVMPSTKKDGHHVCLKSITKQVKDRQTDTPLSGRSKATNALVLTGGTWTPHDLRRTGATMMRGMGVSVDTIERCLNHTEQNKMVRTYQQADLSGEMRQAWARLGEQLDRVLNGTERKILPFKMVA